MNISKNGITRAFGKKVLTMKKNSPHIFFAAGVVGFAGTVVMACRATMKLEETLDEIQHDLKQVKGLGETARENDPEGEYATQQYYKDLGYVYTKAGVRLGRLYGPSIILGVASIGSLTGAHVQLTRRNSALAATAAAISKAYDDYRDRVREEIGEEAELDIYRGVTEQEVEVDGKKSKLKVADPTKYSVYARIFAEDNPNWVKDAEYNRIFLQCQQNYANHLLQARGYLFLNEVYTSLGMDVSKAGQVVGWTLDGEGDGHVDFNMFEMRTLDFVNGHEPRIILDFNVDGPILHKDIYEEF